MAASNPLADIVELLTIMPDGDEAAVAKVRARDARLTKPAVGVGGST